MYLQNTEALEHWSRTLRENYIRDLKRNIKGIEKRFPGAKIEISFKEQTVPEAIEIIRDAYNAQLKNHLERLALRPVKRQSVIPQSETNNFGYDTNAEGID